ncbi:hypothetical protein [Flavobacterium sp.]|uniref:hypothetical protein n=1 Tax=Flavobacterium sp. TaxID=239 RepID=UPI003752C35F
MPVFDKNVSRIKMYVLRSGNNKNITWHSIINKDGKEPGIICQNMLNRFNNYVRDRPALKQTINVIQFYEKGNLIGTSTL